LQIFYCIWILSLIKRFSALEAYEKFTYTFYFYPYSLLVCIYIWDIFGIFFWCIMCMNSILSLFPNYFLGTSTSFIKCVCLPQWFEVRPVLSFHVYLGFSQFFYCFTSMCASVTFVNRSLIVFLLCGRALYFYSFFMLFFIHIFPYDLSNSDQLLVKFLLIKQTFCIGLH
jgi:hypothetical protein